jgi:hypothetical protein
MLWITLPVDNCETETGQCQTALRAALRGSRSALALAHTASGFLQHRKAHMRKRV